MSFAGAYREPQLPPLSSSVLRRTLRDGTPIQVLRPPGDPRHAGPRPQQDPARHPAAHHSHQE